MQVEIWTLVIAYARNEHSVKASSLDGSANKEFLFLGS